ncbi:MAG: hypothetical protein PVF65_06665 [Sphingomonadales bacterium]
MSDTHEHKPESNWIKRELTHFWRLAEIVTAYLVLYSLFAEVVNKTAMAFAGAATAPLAVLVGITIPLPDPLTEIIIFCIITGVLTYIVLKYVCSEQWVQEPVNVKKCWEEITWWNPWSWIKSIVCTVVEVLKWVLKLICGWVEALVIILVVACIVISAIIIFG